VKYYFLLAYEFFSRLAFLPQYLNKIWTGTPTENSKRRLLKLILNEINFDYAVETGTYLARTTKLLDKYVKKVYTTEINYDLYKFAKKKHSQSTIKFMHGKSEKLIYEILNEIYGKTIFYLDSHASGGITSHSEKVTSLRTELNAIRGIKFISKCVIIVDDARNINGTNDYPSIEELKDFATTNKLSMYISTADSYLFVGADIGKFNNRIMNKIFIFSN